MAGGISRSLAVYWSVSLLIAAVGGASVPYMMTDSAGAPTMGNGNAHLRASLASDNRTIARLRHEVSQGQSTITDLRTTISTDQDTITRLRAEVSALPHTTIQDGNITWNFTDLSGQGTRWTMPMTNYADYAKDPRSTTDVYLRTSTGGTIRTLDARPYITPAFFKKVIGDLTVGRSAHEFVREAFNVKAQLVTYKNTTWDNLGTDQYPAETLTQGSGICRDMSILLASMLVAGNDRAHYNLTVKIVYADAKLQNGEIAPGSDPFVQNATTINHMFVEVDYADGTNQFIETTAPHWFTFTGYSGWAFTVPDNGSFEQTAG